MLLGALHSSAFAQDGPIRDDSCGHAMPTIPVTLIAGHNYRFRTDSPLTDLPGTDAGSVLALVNLAGTSLAGHDGCFIPPTWSWNPSCFEKVAPSSATYFLHLRAWRV